MFLLRAEGMAEADRHLLAAVARVVLPGDLGDLSSQLERPASWLLRRARRAAPGGAARAGAGAGAGARAALVMENGLGGFTPDGREYVVVLEGERETPLPWSNVLANPDFGTIVSSAGSAFTWAGNSRENRLTPFANDPLIGSDRRGVLPARRGHRRRVGRDAGAAAAASRTAGAGSSAMRAGVTRYQHAVAGLTPGAGGLRRHRGSGQAGGADADEHVQPPAADQRLRLRRVVPRAAAQRRAAVRRHRRGPGTRRDPRQERLQQRLSRGRSRSSAPARRRRRTPAIAPSSSAAIAPWRAGGALSRAAGRADRRRPRPVRGAAGR